MGVRTVRRPAGQGAGPRRRAPARATPAGTSPTTTDDQFTYTASGPAVTGISPSSGDAAGGDTVTITGSGFTGATDVGFRPTSAAALNVDADTQITATSPAGTSPTTTDD